ncbi:hypothetical protein AB1N83_010194 [Pleurotus pulmonarius]
MNCKYAQWVASVHSRCTRQPSTRILGRPLILKEWVVCDRQVYPEEAGPKAMVASYSVQGLIGIHALDKFLHRSGEQKITPSVGTLLALSSSDSFVGVDQRPETLLTHFWKAYALLATEILWHVSIHRAN